ncbi:hypothetical protein [Thioalkalivibrio sp. XN8]|uniref:hypothetical protein n=1 Tax=Thioalkalivibrio sp. XN8 TaxID=2712863 RepID=UPI0013E9B110|nr:hypothetical protein [Thioalkalivibrio sp. XN8]NGP54454.1 hypothetical protein [Thioalkalivibrio sp. XN8]
MKRLSILLALLLATSVMADTDAVYGELISIDVVTSGSNLFGIRRGEAVVRENGIDVTYTWGGNTCPGRNLTPEEVALLQNALLAPYLRIRISHVNGAGGNLCIVRMAFVNEKYLAQ